MQTQQTKTAPDQTKRGPANLEGIMSHLMGRCMDDLTTSELEWLSFASEHAEIMAYNLQEVVEGIGCMVADDKITGCFQSPNNIFELLHFISQSIGGIRALVKVSSEAEALLRSSDIKPKRNS